MRSVPLCLLLVSFALLTEQQCIMSPHEFACKSTNWTDFWRLFSESSCKQCVAWRGFTITIEDSNLNVIEHFPDIVTNKNYYKLLHLTIKNSSVEVVSERALDELVTLRRLDMSWNKLTNISFVAFLPSTIKYLYFNNNNISCLDNIFEKFVDMQLLDLSHNNFKIIDFTGLSRIIKLNFSNNYVDTLLPFRDFYITDTIDLSQNNLVHFSEKELHCKLNYLDISYNKLVSVEVYGKSMLKLSGNNNLTKLDIPRHVQVDDLDLSSSNALLTIGSEGVIVTHLLFKNSKILLLDSSIIEKFSYRPWSSLDLSNSSIADISAYCFTNRLSFVNLSWNNINLLRNNTFSDSVIDILDISHSNLKTIEKNAFKNFTSKVIKLMGNKLNNVKDAFNDVKVNQLDLSFNPLTTISNHTFVNSPYLSILNFSNCVIERIESQAFCGLHDLKVLDLSYNKLYILESNTFSNLPINILVLNGARIDTIQERALNNMSNIRHLNLSGVGLKTLESYSFQNLSRTELVDLRYNNIPTIPYYLFKDMDSLRRVYLDGNNITTINPFPYRIKIDVFTFSFSGIFKYPEVLNLNLRYLNVTSSTIHRLKDNSFAGLHNLIELGFSNSYVGYMESKALVGLFNLRSLDSQTLFKQTKVIKENTFRDLTVLPFLNLSHLSLESLETNAFFGLKKLGTLLLHNNKLTELKEDIFFGLTSLTTLNLSFNNINSINEKTFRGLEQLRYLYLQFNSLVDIDSRVFSQNLGNLLELHLEYNNISHLNIESFMGLRTLEKLFLQNNSVKDFPLGVFKYLPTLKVLNFSTNLIQLLNTGALSNLKSLEVLDLSNNVLVNLESVDVFFSLKQLELIRLDRNHLKQFDFNRLLINLKRIKYTGISYNKWKCDTLSHIIETLNKKNISYQPDEPVFDDDNIDGVGCVDICKFVYCPHEDLEQNLHYN